MRRFFLPLGIILLMALAPSFGIAAPTQFKVRALWVDPSGLGSAEAIDQMVAKCQRAGINTILADVMCYGAVFFKSPHFQGQVAANDQFDPLACLTRKAHAAGLKAQAWCCVYYEGSSKPIHPEWINRSFDGKRSEQVFLSAAHPGVNSYLLPVLTDLLAYDIDGIHLDYIRFPGTVYDYSDPARNAFAASFGFDPINFLDHPERIVPAGKDVFPIRALHPKSHVDRSWETAAIERTLDRAGIGFSFVSEAPENIASLRVPGLLILSQYYDVSPPMAQAIQNYVERGGNVLWDDAPTHALKKSPELSKLTGLAGGKWIAPRRFSLRPLAGHPLSRLTPTNSFITFANNAPDLNGATLVAKLDSGEPAITVNQFGKGRVVVLGFGAMNSSSEETVSLVKDLVNWFRAEAGVNAPDLLAARRAQWVEWRANQVTSLVRDISRAAKAKNPKLVVTSSGGPSPREYYVCYRDARRWLSEGINDFVFPMNYTSDPSELADILQEQARFIPPGKSGRVYPGLQIYSSENAKGRKENRPMDARIVEKQLRVVQQQGCEGFCLFAYPYLSDEIIEVVRKFADGK